MNDGMERCGHGHRITRYETVMGVEPGDVWVQPVAEVCPFCQRDPSDKPLMRRAAPRSISQILKQAVTS